MFITNFTDNIAVQTLESTFSQSSWHFEPGINRVQALADISHSAMCCHSNETRAPIADPPNSAQLGGTPSIPQFTPRSVQ